MKSHLNLLPLRIRQRAVIRERVFRWGFLCAVTLGLAIAVCIVEWQELLSAKSSAADVCDQCAPLRQMENECQSMQKRLDELKSRESLSATLETSYYAFQSMGVVSNGTSHGQTGVCVRELELATETRQLANTKKQSKGASKKASSSDSKEQSVVSLHLRGNATDDLAIAQFVKSLKLASLFKTVKLMSASGAELLGKEVREYEIRCTF